MRPRAQAGEDRTKRGREYGADGSVFPLCVSTPATVNGKQHRMAKRGLRHCGWDALGRSVKQAQFTLFPSC